jgi:hypothetical protein
MREDLDDPAGKVGLEGPSAELMHNDHIRKLYLGG